MAIGNERFAIGTPIGTAPKDVDLKSSEFTYFQEMLRRFTSNEQSGIILTEGYKVELLFGNFDASKLKEVIVLENTEMVNAFLANFLALGTGGSGGAFALSQDLSDFFLAGIENYAKIITESINRKLIPDLVKLNFGPQAKYPKMQVTDISDKAGKELADILKMYADAQIIKPDEPLEKFIREKMKLTKADPTTAREVKVVGAQAPTDPNAPMKFSERRIKLDESYRKAFDIRKANLKALMQDNLSAMYQGLKSQITSAWKTTGASARIKIGAYLSATGVPAYKSALRDALSEIAWNAIQDAKDQVPSSVKLSERFQLAAPRGGYYAALPTQIKNLIQAQFNLIADTQAQNLEKTVAFQFMSSATGSEDVDQVLFDIDQKVAPIIEGSTASGMSIDAAASNAVATVQNQASLDFFFEPEVLDTIESFTFTNEDPVSEICQSLAGTTFAANDPAIDTYTPPLHHNCKSRLIPNIKGDKGNPDVTKNAGKSLTQKALDSMTLHECGTVDYRIFK